MTCPRGSDMTFDLSGRDGIADDGDLSGPGAFGNLPCGEGFISPLGGRGHAVRGRRSRASGCPDEPVELTVARRPAGRTRAASGARAGPR